MKYLVKKEIPLTMGILKVGDVIDGNDIKYNMLDFSNTNFFQKLGSPKYCEGQPLLYKDCLYFVTKIHPSVTKLGHIYTIKSSNNINITTIDDKTKIIIPTIFWFINSNGVICSDYEERKNISLNGIRFKKIAGNYFKALEDAKNKLNSILAAQN